MGVFRERAGVVASQRLLSPHRPPALPLRRSRSSPLAAPLLKIIQIMSTVALSLLAIAAASKGVLAQDATSSALIPLASKHFDYNNLVSLSALAATPSA